MGNSWAHIPAAVTAGCIGHNGPDPRLAVARGNQMAVAEGVRVVGWSGRIVVGTDIVTNLGINFYRNGAPL